MTALVFPSSPTEGQIYTPSAGISYVFHTPTWRMNPDGDKGDVVVATGGQSLMFDSAVVTTAAKTVLDDASTTAMRATLGAIEEAPNDTYIYARQALGWVEIPGIGGLSPTEYNYNASSFTPPPSTNNMRLNNATQHSATVMYLHHTNAMNVDVSNALRMLEAGNKILMQDKTNAANFNVYVISSAITDFAAYTQVPILATSHGAPCTAGRVMIAAFGMGSTAGVTEAPIDGQEYVRKDADWEVAASGGTGTVTIINSGSFF